MLWVKLPVVDRNQSQSDKFAMGVKNKATGDSKLNGGSKTQVTGNRSIQRKAVWGCPKTEDRRPKTLSCQVSIALLHNWRRNS